MSLMQNLLLSLRPISPFIPIALQSDHNFPFLGKRPINVYVPTSVHFYHHSPLLSKSLITVPTY